MTQLLTRRQVADLAGIRPSSVRDWAHHRGINHTTTPGRHGFRYPTAAVLDALRHPTAYAAHRSLRRFVANPLNH